MQQSSVITTTTAASNTKRVVKLGVVQDKWYANAAENAEAIRKGVLEAASQGAQLVLLQELTLHRYFGDCAKDDAQVFALAEDMYSGPTAQLLSKVAKEAQVHVVGSIYEKRELEGTSGNIKYNNTAVIFNPEGQLSHFTRKQHIPSGTCVSYVMKYYCLFYVTFCSY